MRCGAAPMTSRSSSTSEPEPEMAADSERQGGAAVTCTTEQTRLGEGVRWDARRGELLRVDILAGRVYRDQVKGDGSLVAIRVYDLPWTSRDDRARGGRWWVAARRRAWLRPPGARRRPSHDRRGFTGRHPDERRRLRSPGPVLGRDVGRRPPHLGLVGGGNPVTARRVAPSGRSQRRATWSAWNLTIGEHHD